MGNRATIIFTDGKKSFSPAVYLHWNGGPESVYAFLEELDPASTARTRITNAPALFS